MASYLSYSGTVTTSGTSEAIRLEKALFKEHPEFQQGAKVRATSIGPGQLLVSLTDAPAVGNDVEDEPLVQAFLSYLDRDMAEHPERLIPLDGDFFAKADALLEGVASSDDDVIPDDVTL